MMPGVDREHTTHYESCGCAEAKVKRLEAHVRELEAALNRIRDKLAMRARPLPLGLASIEQIAAATLKGDADDAG
jgi:hypothetical protein